MDPMLSLSYLVNPVIYIWLAARLCISLQPTPTKITLLSDIHLALQEINQRAFSNPNQADSTDRIIAISMSNPADSADHHLIGFAPASTLDSEVIALATEADSKAADFLDRCFPSRPPLYTPSGTSGEFSVYMDPMLFRAIMEDKVDVVKQKVDQLERKTTPNKNTSLHVAAQFGKANCVDAILSLCPSLLLQLNDQEETALHIAAKRGDLRMVEALLESAKKDHKNYDTEVEGKSAREWLIKKMSKKKDTALHEAVKYNRLTVVNILINEDPDFEYSANEYGETPLYLAARKGFFEVAVKILETCRSPVYDGPLGRTALHAAVACNHEGLCTKLLSKIPELAKTADKIKRTPLHFAAWFDRSSLVETLLNYDPTSAYMRDDEGMTPLHIAAKEGHSSFISMLLKHCPDCYEMVDKDGRNALHIAAENGNMDPRKLKVILNNPQIISLINEGDKDGNTPLHLLAISRRYIKTFLKQPELDKKAVNYSYLTALDTLPPISFSTPDAVDHLRLALEHDVTPTVKYSKGDNDNKDDASIIDKVSEIHVVAATLIATVSFAAGFTLPGGYNGDEGPNTGTATLAKKSAFQAFVISNTIALLLSICAVFTHFFRVLKINVEFNKYITMRGAYLTITAMGAMVIAYATGTFVVLRPSLGLATVNSIIGCFFFLYVFNIIRMHLAN
ncbi:hypothetical protein FNV43_RR01527 [Rhamnella rubrinervis]|uniref:PGG domain-containing protein n=1 Tax=Rhamnella rubrinervis TaxID=2594499 RepID=A0A8K0HRM7_9ROSA|nr:hypothetical protein FNV43_RR01527 [Rhamnella rubrinervis]